MALTTCPECSQKVSTGAAFCPQCGRPGSDSHPMSVAVRDVEMHFASMVGFMVKATFAAIPALMILVVIGGILAAMFGGVFLGRR